MIICLWYKYHYGRDCLCLQNSWSLVHCLALSADSHLAECMKVHLFGELLYRGHDGNLQMDAWVSLILKPPFILFKPAHHLPKIL